MEPALLLWCSVAAIFLLSTLGVAGCSAAKQRAEDDWKMMRTQMVKEQIEARGIGEKRVLDAMDRVPRHLFVPDGVRDHSYADSALPIGHEQTISQPYIVGFMTESLMVQPTDKILEIGTGSGYQAAILGELAKEVYSIEIVAPLGERAGKTLSDLGYKNVHVRVGDGYKGWPEAAPFDAVIVTAAPDHVPQPLLDQLKVGGRLVIPVGSGTHNQSLVLMEKTAKGVERHEILPVRFVPMTGEAQQKN